MPVYTYRCENCGVQFDIQQSFTEDSLTRCPECKKHALRKVLHPVGIVFKGSGFYSTDHHSPSGQTNKKEEKREEEKKEEKKEEKTEEKKQEKKEEKKEPTVAESTPKE
jgi:putative FmdB family regulatory protein